MSFTLLNGLVGGLVATAVMTVFMMVLGDDSPPPTAELWAKYFGDQEAENYMVQGMILHFLYGITAGSVFAVGLLDLGLSGTSIVTALYGMVYGLMLQVIGFGLWMKTVIGITPSRRQMVGFIVFHLIYGLVLSSWLVTVTI